MSKVQRSKPRAGLSGAVAAERIPVEPGVLTWARKSAGFSEALAAKRLQVKQSTVARWESGEQLPNIGQLRRMAKHYHRPLAVLLLDEAPRDFMPLRDFRTTGTPPEAWSPQLIAETRRALAQREVFLELAELAPDTVQASINLDLSRETDAKAAATAIRLLLDMDDWPTDLWASPEKALTHAIATVEELGILVVQLGDVPIGEMRGFSVSERPFPIIALNGADWPRPRLFTLFHELAHIAGNASAICDLHEAQRRTRSEDELEHFCNAVAAAVLMPADAVLSFAEVRSAGAETIWSLADLERLSKRFGASSEAYLLRLISLGRASWALYWMLKPQLEEKYADARRRQKLGQTGGPNYYVVKARDLGHSYVVSVLEAFHSRVISSLDVADYLDVRYDQIGKLEKAAAR